MMIEDSDKLFYQYAIVRVDYDKNKSRKQQRIDAVTRLSEKAIKIYGEKYKFLYTNVLVLWNNLPRQDYLQECLGYSEQELIRSFCVMLKKKWRYRLYIESPLTLTDKRSPYFGQILETLLMIWKESGIIPIFLEDNFLENEYMEVQTSERLKEIEKQKNCELEKARKGLPYSTKLFKQNNETIIIRDIRDENMEYFKKFFSSLDNLLSIIGTGISVEDDENTKENFIDLYYKWQRDAITVEECLVKLGDISRASWYRYVNNFEKSPIYEEYSLLFNFRSCKKKGMLPNVFAFLKQFREDNIEKIPLDFELLGSVNRWNCYLKFDEINALNDVERVAYACRYKIGIMRHKGILNKKLKELNLTEEDIQLE